MIEFEDKIKGIAVPVPFNGWAPGNYMCRCGKCNSDFYADKLAVRCLKCAISSIDPLLIDTVVQKLMKSSASHRRF